MTTFAIRYDDSRMALLYLIAREFTEDLDLNRILRRVLIATARVVGATNGSFFVLDGHGHITKSLFLRGSQVIDQEMEVVGHILEEGLAGWVKRHQQGVLIPDADQDQRWYMDNDNPHLLVQRSVVSVPLLNGQNVIGILTLTHDQPGYFDNSDLTILNEIAKQATTAILNARIYHAEQRRRKLSNALAQVSRRMNSTLDSNEIFELILEQLAFVVDFEQSILFLLRNGYLTVTAARGLSNETELLNTPARLYQNDLALQITLDYLPVRSDDLQKENSWFKDVTDTTSRSWLGVPLVANNVLIGAITIAQHRTRAYSEEDVQIVSALASQAAVVVNNTSLMIQLRAAQKRYTKLFEESSDMLLIMDHQGFILDANRKACRMLRRPKDAFIGSSVALLDQALGAIFREQLETLTRDRERTAEVVIKDAYGQEIPLEINAKQVELEGDQPAIQWACRDITPRYELAKMRQDLTNMIVHDLRGPMGTLLGTVEILPLLLAGLEAEPAVQEVLNLVDGAIRSGKTLKDLIDSMLDLSKMEQGNFPLRLTSVNLSMLLAEAEDQVTPQAEAKQIALTFERIDPQLSIAGDPSILRRILVNLTDNAIKYTQSAGQVTVRVTPAADKITFQVVDNGPGIPPDRQGSIFDKFARLDPTSPIQGVGLGLAFCRMAVEAHHGKIWLESQAGQGTTFIFEIPRSLAALNGN